MVDSRWIPLESNPEVFNGWAEKAGLVTSQMCFHEVYGFDDELLEMIPQPVKAVILLFPLDEATRRKHEAEDDEIEKKGQPLLDDTLMWIKQRIGNACGTMALIHALANSDVTIVPNSALAQFIESCKGKTPLERAEALETTPLFAKIHKELASTGQSAIPEDLNTELHFSAFVAAPEAPARTAARAAQVSVNVPPPVGGSGARSVAEASGAAGETKAGGETKRGTKMRLVELDGTRRGPVDRGECGELLQDAVQVIRSKYMTETNSIYFSLLALAPPHLD
ncbi:hypothetical protein AMATHDRAFT_71689 [Amanita thiersii Skay4041]|uniref:Ubiquitin carboxyl-terminal hydrolase n=1 Tax=Amanita thiersii Skay4041 TaxID=703135 RepID=A0A2A9NCU7_9AGAR|nr:hypothetical protein AMATHDRAFT_71689 [Amanita thiersii Skay4041]